MAFGNQCTRITYIMSRTQKEEEKKLFLTGFSGIIMELEENFGGFFFFIFTHPFNFTCLSTPKNYYCVSENRFFFTYCENENIVELNNLCLIKYALRKEEKQNWQL